MTAPRAGGCELTEFVADHVFRNIDGDELVTVVNGKGHPNHFRNDGRTPRPGLDDLRFVPLVVGNYLLEQVMVDKWPFF